MKRILIVLSLACLPLLAEEISTETSAPSFEVGATLGTPAVLNANLGYWGKEVPVLTRVSGMYYGQTRGIQADAGYAFDREGSFRQFVAATFTSLRLSVDDDNDRVSFTGAGPTYGLNWNGFSAQAGLLYGSGESVDTELFVSEVRNLDFSLIAQVGYTFLF